MPRTFGVEIECVMERDPWNALRQKLPGWTISTDGSVFCGGADYETCGEGGHRCDCDYCGYDYYDDAPCDLHVGAEIKTPILEGMPGFRELKKGFKTLKDSGATVNMTCGMHVHHGGRDLTVSQIIHLLKTWDANRDTIEQLVNDDRIDGEYSYSLERYGMDQLDALMEGTGQYQGFNDEQKLNYLRSWFGHGCELNVGALARHGTIEFRLHHGTMDYDEAEAWVRFGQGLMDDVAGRQRVKDELDSGDLLKYTCSTKKSQEILAAKLERRREAVLRAR